MKKRKTFNIQELKDIINKKNQVSTCTAKTRDGWNSLMSEILCNTGNYKGFRYLGKEQVPEGHKAGIEKNNLEKYIFPDESRIYYF